MMCGRLAISLIFCFLASHVSAYSEDTSKLPERTPDNDTKVEIGNATEIINDSQYNFDVNYRCTNMATTRGLRNAEVVYYRSPNFGSGLYNPNETCVWHVRSAPNTRIKFTLLFCELENPYIDPRDGRVRCFDYLYIRDGIDESSDKLYTFCGTYSTQRILYSTGNELYMRFTADGSVQYRGFTAATQEVPLASNACSSSPCRNGGTCTPILSLYYRCTCASGYTGTRCETRT